MNVDDILPQMLTGNALLNALSYYPEYPQSIRQAPTNERLLAINNLLDIFYPFAISTEVYTKLYTSLHRSLSLKQGPNAIKQLYHPTLISGAVSWSFLAPSGFGKTTAMNRAAALLNGFEVHTFDDPYRLFLPVLKVECPFDSSPKALLIEILRQIDIAFGSKYYENAVRSHLTTDGLIGVVSNVMSLHICCLIIDEIQNVIKNSNGSKLLTFLQLLNNSSGVSMVLMGTTEVCAFLENDYKLARRTLGLKYERLSLNDEFVGFVKTIWQYQYVKQYSPLSDGIIAFIYEHSGGLISNVITLIKDAQEISIIDGSEELNLESLNKAYRSRMTMLHSYFRDPVNVSKPTTRHVKSAPISPCAEGFTVKEYNLISAVNEAKNSGLDLITALKNIVLIEEI